MVNKYLVIYEIEGEICEPAIETATQIFDKMDLSDCYDITIKRIFLIDGSKVGECRFRGTWHDPKEPLKMVIEAMYPAPPLPYDIGYGTDH